MRYLLLICLFPLVVQAQSPWARSKSDAFVQVAYHFIPTYGTLFGKGGEDIILDRLVSERQIQLYGEIGLTKKTTMFVAAPFVLNERGDKNPDSPYAFTGEYNSQIRGVGNVQLAVRHQFLSKKVALAGTLKIGLPSGDTRLNAEDLKIGYPAWTIQPMVSAGMGLGVVYGFVYGSYGYRSNDYSHFVNSGVEAGVKLGPVWLIGFSDIVLPLENGARELPEIQHLTGLYVNDQGWVSVGAKVLWEITPHFGVNLSFAGAAWAQNVPKSPGIGTGVYCKLK
ncbi:MAG: hypothetical protein JNJ57_19840 [Saprospiraceae bacterium]|nr:hypothetical protein [Saprospiraceae bacterium]